MFFKKNKKEEQPSVDLPSITFTLLPTDNVLVKVEWPTQEKFNVGSFGEMLNILLEGKFNEGVYVNAVDKYAGNHKQHEIGAVLKGRLHKRDNSSTNAEPAKEYPIVAADRVFATHFSQNGVTVNGERL